MLDDSLNVPVPGRWLYLNATKYGAFSFSFPAAWQPMRGGLLHIQAAPTPYTLKPLRVPLNWWRYDAAPPLALRPASPPGRGRPTLHGLILQAQPGPPPVYLASAHAARP